MIRVKKCETTGFEPGKSRPGFLYVTLHCWPCTGRGEFLGGLARQSQAMDRTVTRETYRRRRRLRRLLRQDCRWAGETVRRRCHGCLPVDNVILVSGKKESIPLQASGCHGRQIFDWAEDRCQRLMICDECEASTVQICMKHFEAPHNTKGFLFNLAVTQRFTYPL